jgi:putative ABC transport system substrate-binding protein
MRRRLFIAGLASAAVARSRIALAQTSGRTQTVGLFTAGADEEFHANVIAALRELGWIEGKTIAYAWRPAKGHLARLPELAEELVRLNVDVIVAAGTLAPPAAKQATTTIPIVMAPAGDPVAVGLVASLAYPGGNVTRLSLMAPDLGGKRLEILKEILRTPSKPPFCGIPPTPTPDSS